MLFSSSYVPEAQHILSWGGGFRMQRQELGFLPDLRS